MKHDILHKETTTKYGKNIKYVCKSYHESFFKQDEKWVRYPAWDINNNFCLLALKNIK